VTGGGRASAEKKGALAAGKSGHTEDMAKTHISKTKTKPYTTANTVRASISTARVTHFLDAAVDEVVFGL
jgi:hypothetical protein